MTNLQNFSRCSSSPFRQFTQVASQTVAEQWKSVELRWLFRHSLAGSKLLYCNRWNRSGRSYCSGFSGTNSERWYSTKCK